jgi:iron(III) transport system substrate-binding protein
MPNPASSGTGFFDVTAWLTLFGDDNGKGGGWKYMDGCTRTSRSTRTAAPSPATWPPRRVRGRHQLRVPRQQQQGQGRAYRARLPQGRPGLGPGSLRHPQGHQEARCGQKLADWASSKDAMLLYGKNFAITAQPGVAAPLANVPRDYEARLVKMDFYWEAENRERILAEWTKRYNAKSEKR